MMSSTTEGTTEGVVSIGLRDRAPSVAPGTVVEIEVVETEGPSAVYADLLANPDNADDDKVLAASLLLEHCQDRYLRTRKQDQGMEQAESWTRVARLLQAAATTLDDATVCMDRGGVNRSSGNPGSGNPGFADLGEQASVLARLLRTLRSTLLSLLKERVEPEAPVWQAIDGSFDDLCRRTTELQAAVDQVLDQYRTAAAQLRYLNIREYLSDPIAASSFTNYDDYVRSMQLAERIGLDLQSLTLGLYQNLPVLAAVRGIKL